MIIIYTAKRNIQAGHTIDVDYTIDIGVDQYDYDLNNKGTQSVAFDGSTVSVIHNMAETITISTLPLDMEPNVTIDDMREFLYSVATGETFSIDGDTVIMDSFKSPFKENRRSVTDDYSYSFKVRKL